jgi:thiamine-phosphate pyrophosphorylase
MKVELRGIYGIVDSGLTTAPLAMLEAMLAGGIRVVQYRAKNGVDRDLLAAMHARTQAQHAALIVNDDLEAALLADGWHAGQEDLALHDVASVRVRLGTRTFGVSCDRAELAHEAASLGADYVGVGPLAATATKGDAGPPIGVAGVRAVARATPLPVVAIGGIDASNLADVVASGAAMAAVASAISGARDPRLAARELVRRWAALDPT